MRKGEKGKKIPQTMGLLAENIGKSATKGDHDAIYQVVSEIKKVPRIAVGTPKIFTVSLGRSRKIVGEPLTMRLAQLGYLAYDFEGDSNVPATQPGDIVIAISMSGGTTTTIIRAIIALLRGATLVIVTKNENSFLYEIGNIKILVKELINNTDLLPLGTLPETIGGVIADAIIAELMSQLDLKAAYLKKNHANLDDIPEEKEEEFKKLFKKALKKEV